jgi:putative MATE family efflux protein
VELAAAIGYAGTLLFFLLSVAIGLTIGVTANVSRSLGSGDRALARRQATSGTVIAFLVLAAVTALVMPFQDRLLEAMGASGATLDTASGFLTIVLPTTPFLAVGMALSGVLRAAGDAKRAMYVTLAGGIATAILDPIFIFALDLRVTGAAIVSVISRFVLMGLGLYGAFWVHRLLERPRLRAMAVDVRPLAVIALPAVLTQLATPVGNAYVTAAMAGFGVQAVAAWAVIGRLFPLMFGGLFALSGSVGAIFGQNLGAKRYDRVTRTLSDSLKLATLYVLCVWVVLAITSGWIADAFQATGEARELIRFFCIFVAPTFLFAGALFVANAAFNNLGFPMRSTLFNWGRSTLGIVPFCWVGAKLAGAEGVLMGWGAGGVVFGVAAALSAFAVITRMEAKGVEVQRLAINPHDRPALETHGSGI